MQMQTLQFDACFLFRFIISIARSIPVTFSGSFQLSLQRVGVDLSFHQGCRQKEPQPHPLIWLNKMPTRRRYLVKIGGGLFPPYNVQQNILLYGSVQLCYYSFFLALLT